MRTKRPRIVVLVLILFWVGIAPPLAAQPMPAPESRSFLLLGFFVDNVLSARARDVAAQRILATRLGVSLRPLLDDHELACPTPECLTQIFRTHGPQYLVGGSIVAEPASSRHIIQVWLLKTDSANPGWVSGTPRLEERVCHKCSESDQLPTLEETLVALIRSLDVAASSSLPIGQPPAPTQQALPCRKARAWSFSRAFLLGSSATLAVSGLIAGFSVIGASNQDIELRDDRSGWSVSARGNWTRYSAGGFAVAALGAVGASVALVPTLWRREQPGDACAATSGGRWSPLRGAFAGAFTGLLLSSLISAAILSAQSGLRCVEDNPQVTCSFATQSGVSWGLTGAWALGLTISLALPSRNVL